MTEKVTIQQVAAAAGVSTSTVSNVLNGRASRMQPSTKERVAEAMSRLGYRPNRAARQLRTGRTRTVGLIVPSVGNPFWGAFARELEQAAFAAGYNLLLCNSGRDPQRELGYVEELWDGGVHDVVLCTSLPSLLHLSGMIDQGLHIVTFDRPSQPDDPASVSSISIDNYVGGHIATSHLTSLGHHRLSFVSGALSSVNRTGRYRGFLDAIEASGLTRADTVTWAGIDTAAYSDLDADDVGRRAAHELFALPDPPTAVVAINDMTALGFCRGLRDLGLRVGRDVSVVGFDDIILADLYDPPLTTVRQPIAHMARLAIDEVIAYSAAAPLRLEQGKSLLLRPELVIRASTAPLLAQAARGSQIPSDLS
jgi:DNA-binding LacI/PurR family transcriptional regulator